MIERWPSGRRRSTGNAVYPTGTEGSNPSLSAILEFEPDTAVLAVLASNNVGENNKGYLEILKPLADKGQEKTVADENSDRKAVYTAIADKTGAKVEAVGRNRAKDVAKVAPSGTMIQSEAGVWSAKK